MNFGSSILWKWMKQIWLKCYKNWTFAIDSNLRCTTWNFEQFFVQTKRILISILCNASLSFQLHSEYDLRSLCFSKWGLGDLFTPFSGETRILGSCFLNLVTCVFNTFKTTHKSFESVWISSIKTFVFFFHKNHSQTMHCK